MPDLGTYWVSVVLTDGAKFFMEWSTGGRYAGVSGKGGWCHSDSRWLPPPYESHDDVMASIRCMFSEGNFSCDCNLRLFVAYANGEDLGDPGSCSSSLAPEFVLVRPPNKNAWEMVELYA